MKCICETVSPVIDFEVFRSPKRLSRTALMNPGMNLCALLSSALLCLLSMQNSSSAQQIPYGVVNVPGTLPEIGERQNVYDGIILNVLPGGSVGGFLNASEGGVVNILGGSVGGYFNAEWGSQVNMLEGSIDRHFTASRGSIVNMAGGTMIDATVEGQMNLTGGTVGAISGWNEINISGGTVGYELFAHAGAVANISGGTVGGNLIAEGFAVINLSGGTVGTLTSLGCQLNIFGGEFLHNGTAATTTRPTFWDKSDVLAGTLQDGSPFIFTGTELTDIVGYYSDVNLIDKPIPDLDPTPIVVDSSSDLHGIRAGQTLTLQDGGVLMPNFAVVGATLNIRGGTVERGLEIVDSVLNMSGGNVTSQDKLSAGTFNVYHSSVINVSGGAIGDSESLESLNAHAGSIVNVTGGVVYGILTAGQGSIVNISGGMIGDENSRKDFIAAPGSTIAITGGLVRAAKLQANGALVEIAGGTVATRLKSSFDSVVNISGGDLVYGLEVTTGSVVNISGGKLADELDVFEGCKATLVGTEFYIDGKLMDFLIPGEPFEITERGMALSGRLSDGSSFHFQLNHFNVVGHSFISPAASIAIKLVPELESTVLLVIGCPVYICFRF